MNERKLIQITSCTGYDAQADGMMTRIYGLADDGTVWRLAPGRSEWDQLPDLPKAKPVKCGMSKDQTVK